MASEFVSFQRQLLKTTLGNDTLVMERDADLIRASHPLS